LIALFVIFPTVKSDENNKDRLFSYQERHRKLCRAEKDRCS